MALKFELFPFEIENSYTIKKNLPTYACSLLLIKKPIHATLLNLLIEMELGLRKIVLLHFLSDFLDSGRRGLMLC